MRLLSFKFYLRLLFWIILALLVFWYGYETVARAETVFQLDEGLNNSNSYTLDADDDATTTIELQFGLTLGKTLQYDIVDGRFEFNDDLQIDGDLETLGNLSASGNIILGSASGSLLSIRAKIGDDLDFNQYEISNLVIDKGSDFPASAVDGMIFYRSDLDNLYMYDGVEWDLMNISDGGDAGLLDGLDSLDFLRSNTSDSFTSGTLTFGSGTIVDMDAGTVFLDDIASNALRLDADDTGGDVTLQFGTTLAETLHWNSSLNRFELSDDVYIADGLSIDGNTTIGNDNSDTLTINSKLGADVDFEQKTALELVIDKGTSFPSSPAPVDGQIFYRVDENSLYLYNGVSWDKMNDGINGGNAETLDSIDSLSFLRSDTSDDYTSGTLTFGSGTVLDIDGNTVNLDEITNNTLILDSDDSGGNITLQFGATLAQSLQWDSSNARFRFTDDVMVDGTLRVGDGTSGDYLIDDVDGIRREGGFGYFSLGNNAEYPQIYMGSSTGAIAGYIDVDNGAPLYLNTLESGSAPVIIGDGGLNPETSATDIGSASYRWDEAYIRRLDASGSGTFGGNIDLNLNQLVEARAENLASAPTCDTASLGRKYFNTSDDVSYICTATGWKQETNSSGSGTAIFFLDIFGGVRTSMGAGTIAGGNSSVLSADAGGNSMVAFSFPLPSDWAVGTDIMVEMYWSPNGTNTGNARWNFDYAANAPGETVLSGDFVTIDYDQSAPGVDAELISTGSTFLIPASVLASGDMININLNRQGGHVNDTFTGEARIHMFKVMYTKK